MLERCWQGLALSIAVFLVACGQNDQSEREKVPAPWAGTPAEIARYQGKNCDPIGAEIARIPPDFLALNCSRDKVHYRVPDPLFTRTGFDNHAFDLTVERISNASIINPPNELEVLHVRKHGVNIDNGMLRDQVGRSQGYDPVLKSDIIPYVYVHPKNGVVCESINMSSEPRSFMVRCFLARDDWVIWASGPDGSILELSNSLARIGSRLTR